MSYAVQFAPEALDQLDAIEDYIASAGYPLAAVRYVDAIVAYCNAAAGLRLQRRRAWATAIHRTIATTRGLE